MADKADMVPVARSKSSAALSVAASEMSGYTGKWLGLYAAQLEPQLKMHVTFLHCRTQHAFIFFKQCHLCMFA
jgi:hypothetical protein